jgi:hypothetical protein
MKTTITTEDLEAAGPLADTLLELFATAGVHPRRAAAAMAVALGGTCQQFQVDPSSARLVFDESYRASEDLAREEERR